MLPLVLTLPIPSGISVPCLAIGGAYGRLIGEYVSDVAQTDNPAAGYAIVSGAALLSGVTHAYSSTIIVMEMTGQLEYLFPALISVVTAVMVSQTLNMSIFDRIVLDKGLPFLPALRVDQYRKRAIQIMEPTNPGGVLLRNAYINEIHTALTNTQDSWLPVVNNERDKILLGMVRRAYLEEIFQR